MLKKRIFGSMAVMVTVMLVFALAGCGGGAGNSSGDIGDIGGGGDYWTGFWEPQHKNAGHTEGFPDMAKYNLNLSDPGTTCFYTETANNGSDEDDLGNPHDYIDYEIDLYISRASTSQYTAICTAIRNSTGWGPDPLTPAMENISVTTAKDYLDYWKGRMTVYSTTLTSVPMYPGTYTWIEIVGHLKVYTN